MKTLSEKEFSEFNAKMLFTEQAEKAKQAQSPVLREIQKYIPNTEYGYQVRGGEYPEFYNVRIEFTQNDIRFHLYKVYKENKYMIVADMEHFKNVSRYDIERITKLYEKPCNIGVFSTKKVNAWINYYTAIYNQVAKENTEHTLEISDFLKSIENEHIRWQDKEHTKGNITRNGLCFNFSIKDGHISQELSLSYHGTNDYHKFHMMANNHFFPTSNY